jgi:benzoyl-CoA reductase/2-hydroxyglutaryl-CoA dehydratase subunit BcrC/BadD/HgdB
MTNCSSDKNEGGPPAGPCGAADATSCSGSATQASGAEDSCAWFANMIQNCLQYASAAKGAGGRIVGIMCEYTPRELIMAAGGVPVCLCGGSEKTIPAAEEHLPANLCPLIKSSFGYHVQRNNPFLEMADLVVGETTCDGKKKMYELMGESRPMYVLELPQKADDPDALEHWVRELEKFRSFLESRFKTQVTEAKIREAIAVMNRERALRRELAGFMAWDRPPLSGRRLLDFKSSISGIPVDFQQYERAIEILRTQRRDGDGPAPVRVLMTGVPVVHGAERVLDIIETGGALVVCMENCTGLKPVLEDVEESAGDPIRALAEKYFHLPCSVMSRNDRRMDVLRQMAKTYRPECVVELIWQACLTYDVESNRIKRFVENELGMPYLRIETDYSPSDSARIALRVEALVETVRSRRSAAQCGGR